MSLVTRRARPDAASRSRWTRLTRLAAIPLALVLATGVASAYWTAGSVAGGNGASATTTLDQGATPTASAAARAVTVSWAASTLSNGNPVNGYIVKRYDGALAPQTILSACAGTVTATTCVENDVPVGTWTYSVTPVFATSWRGAESVRSGTVVVVAPTLSISPTQVKPGTTLTGTAARFIVGETLQYRLDHPATGTVLAGSLTGSPTPAAVPAGGGGVVAVTVPPGTSDGAHTVYAVTSPSGSTAAAGIVVDGTPPPLPELTHAPAALSNGSVSFEYTEAEASATVDCRLDAAAFASCASPVAYSGLADGSHTFNARATDTLGNVTASTSYTWTVHLDLPSIAIAFPTPVGLYNDSSFNAGCGTASTGDVCGTASDAAGISAVSVSLRRQSTGLYWNGTTFTSASEVFLASTGTTSWSSPMAAASFPAEGSYTVRAQAADGAGNLGYDSRTVTIDRTAPVAPAITSGASGTTGGGVTISFTGEAGASFECLLDVGAWAGCANPKAYSALTDGAHTFAVRAVDGAGNVGPTTSRTWTVDATAPTIGTTFPLAGGRYNTAGYNPGCATGSTGDICGTASDARSALSSVAISVQRASTGRYLTGTAFSAVSQNWIAPTGTTSWRHTLAAASFPTGADDTYTLVVRVTDAVGNVGTATTAFVIDRIAPTGAGLTTTNASGGTAGQLGEGDTFTLDYSESIAPASIITGWDGASPRSVVVRVASNDVLTVYDATFATQLPLGTLDLIANYVPFTTTYGLAEGTATPSTLTWNGSSLTVTLGTPSRSPNTARTATKMEWTPAAGATDLAGNAASPSPYIEPDTDIDF